MAQIDFSKRADGEEIMDDLDCKGEVVHQTLRELDFINHWLGGNPVTLSGLDKLLRQNGSDERLSICDLGCGSGAMLRLIARRSNQFTTLLGIDANVNITTYARQHSQDFPAIQFEALNIFSNEFKQLKFDVVVATLFFHHFSDEQLISFFRHLKSQVRVGLVVNDIHRHPLAYHSIRLLTKLFSKSSMVKYDAPLSVARAFKKVDLVAILEKAGIKNYSLTWKWAFRWQLIVNF